MKNHFPCGKLLPIWASFAFWFLGFIGLPVNFVLFVHQQLQRKKNVKNVTNPLRWLFSVLSFSSFMFFNCDPGLASSDIYFGSPYKINENSFQKSIVCHLICFVFLFSCFTSLVMQTILATLRYLVVHCPFKAQNISSGIYIPHSIFSSCIQHAFFF